jgi:rhodanese-related sulfurtransferase
MKRPLKPVLIEGEHVMVRITVGLKKHFYALVGLMILSLPSVAWSAMGHTPPSLAGVTVLTAEKAKAMVDGGTLIVDARVANEYVEEHIKGAVSVPYKEKSEKSVDFNARLDSFDLAKLPADKNKAIIFYCNGPECWKSYKACVTAVKAGYNSVYWLRGGAPEWKAKGYPME